MKIILHLFNIKSIPLGENICEDLLEPVELVEAEEIVTASLVVQPNLVVSPRVNFHTADTAVMAVAPVKDMRERRFSISSVQKCAQKFKKAFSLPRIGSKNKKYVFQCE